MFEMSINFTIGEVGKEKRRKKKTGEKEATTRKKSSTLISISSYDIILCLIIEAGLKQEFLVRRGNDLDLDGFIPSSF